MLIRNIWAVGRNYQEHAKELGNDIPEKPLFFLKAGSSASVNSTEIILPHFTNNVHHEVELALKFSSRMSVVEGAVALDLTERDFQNAAKKKGEPWTLSKSFHGACSVSAFFQIKSLMDLEEKTMRLFVNDELRQETLLSRMIFKPQELIEYALEHFPVCPGDLLLTGTPAGVGALHHEDRVRAEIQGEIFHSWVVKKEPPR